LTYGCINIQAGRTSRKLLPSDKGSVQSARIRGVRPVSAWIAAFFEIDAVFLEPPHHISLELSLDEGHGQGQQA
jgi:hypothetical protein